MIFTHSGNCGDILYSLPTINHLVGGRKEAILYIKDTRYEFGTQYSALKDLLLLQPCVAEVHPFVPSDDNWNYYNWPGLKFDVDLDTARYQRQKGKIQIVKRYFDQFGIVDDWTRPWLKVDGPRQWWKIIDRTVALIHLTPRWNGLQYDWKKIYNEAKEKYNEIYFIGFESEHKDFCERFGSIEYFKTDNLLELARLIRDCDALYCNQNSGVVLAQGLGKEYYLVRNGNKTNVHMGTANEHLLGAEYLLPSHTLFGPNMPPDSHINFIMGDKNIQR